MLNVLLPAALLIVVPLWEQLRRGRPFMLFAVVAAIYLVFAGLAVVIFRSSAVMDWLTQPTTTDRAFHDTYYVVSHSLFGLWLAILFAVIALATWAQTKANALYYPRQTCAAFWGLHLSILASAVAPLLTQVDIPGNYANYERAFQALLSLTTLTSFAAFLFLCMLAVLFLLSIVRRISKRSND